MDTLFKYSFMERKNYFCSKSVGSIEAKCPKCNMYYRIEQSGDEIKVREAAVHYRAGSR